MKTKISYIILSVAVLAMTAISCAPLDETTYSDLPVNKIYKTLDDADGAVRGIYPQILQGTTYLLPTILGPTSSTADTRFMYCVAGNIQQHTEHVGNYWEQNYTLVRYCNEVVVNLWKSPIPEQDKIPYIAEAMVLRALGYFRLVRLWGDIPFRIDRTDHHVSQFPITPMEEIYRTIIADMEWALPYMWEPGDKPKGRIDVMGGRMLLAEIYLTCASSARAYDPSTSAKALKPYFDSFDADKEAYWTRVRQLTAMVISSTAYKLETSNWMNLWGYSNSYDNRSNPEHIWTSQVIPGVFGSKNMFRYTPTYSDYCPGQTVGELFMTWNWAASFDRNDVRYKDGIIWKYWNTSYPTDTDKRQFEEYWRRDVDNQSSVQVGNILVETGPYPGSTAQERGDIYHRYNAYQRLQTKKFYDMTYTVTNASIGPAIQMPYYRMAEAFLFFAEAENELYSCTQFAVNMINALRIRVGLTGYTQSQFSREEFRDKIIDEYFWEFAMEAKDLFVAMRTGQLEKRNEGVEIAWDGNDVSSHRVRTADNYWLPYPLEERNTNPELRNVERMNYN